MIDPIAQLERFMEAARLLGGQRAAAAILGINERTMRRIAAGQIDLHEGYLRDIATALLDRATACRELERQLSPQFHANLTPEQRAGPSHHAAYHLRERD
jgi:Spy/CpxP family protein refolding chaperone